MKLDFGEWSVVFVGPKDWMLCRHNLPDPNAGEIMGYHKKLSRALLTILNKRIGGRTASDVKEVIDVIREEASKLSEQGDRIEKMLMESRNKKE